jgi:hypothetical protein
MVCVVGGMAACSRTSGSKISVQGVVASAAAKSESALTFHLTLSGTEVVPGVSGVIRESGSGDVDLSSQRAQLTFDIVNPTGGSSGGSDLGSETSPPSGTLSIIQIGPKTWIQDPVPGSGEKWILDSASDSGPASTFPSPAKIFDTLRSNATSVTFLGSATVDGTKTSHYQLTVPTDVFNNLGGGNSSDSGSAPGSTTVQIWVDASDLIRRLGGTVNESGTTSTMTMDFTNYGESVDIQPPPSNDVATIPTMDGGAGGPSDTTTNPTQAAGSTG